MTPDPAPLDPAPLDPVPLDPAPLDPAPFYASALRRRPDFEAPELRAWDAADTLILDEAAGLISGAEITVIGDDYGALTLGALHAGATAVRVHQDPLAGELALGLNADALGVGGFTSLPLSGELVEGATVVLLRLPRSLDALEEIAALVAAYADPSVVVIAGGRLKHMTVRMNEVLARHFGRVDVSLARQKSRLLIAREPIAGPLARPRRRFHADEDLWVVATGGVFAGTSIDIGTRALLEVLDRVPTFARAIDLGSGAGILAARLARDRPGTEVLASDQSAAAAASAALTMEANGLAGRVTVTRDDALSREPPASADLILLNPPFHVGGAVHAKISTRLFAAAGRVLRPGGELWTVWNTPLAYRSSLQELVGETRQIARTTKFTVTASVAR